MLKIVPLLKKMEQLSIDNSPVILTVIGVTGVVGTAYLAARGAYKQGVSEAVGGVASDPKQRVKETYTYYIPAVVTGALTCTAVVYANRIGTKRTAALAAAYTVTEQAFSEYREKVVARVGDRKEQTYRDEIAQERINRTSADASQIIISGTRVLCYDAFTDRYFESDMETIKKAQNDTNYALLQEGYQSLSDFYERVGLPATSMSEEVGWTTDKMLDVDISTSLSPDGKPCLAIDFLVAPIRNFHRQHH